MHKTVMGLLLIAVITLVLSCNKRELKDCPAFKEDFLTHLNYNLGDTLTYTNQINANELKFVVTDISKSDAYKCTTEGFENDGSCPCLNTVDFNITGLGNNMVMLTGLRAEGLDDGVDPISNPIAGYTVFSTDWPIENRFRYNHLFNYAPLLLKSTDSTLPEIEINGITYRDAVQSVVDTLRFANQPRLPELEVWRMIIAEGKGIVQFEDRTTRQIWSLK